MRGRTGVIVGLAAGLVFGGGALVAQAAIPDADGTIHACYVKPGGALRVTDSACKKGETPIAWNQAGVPGADGVSGREVVREHTRGFFTGLTALCSPGKKVVGGGGNVSLFVNDVPKSWGAALDRSEPRIDPQVGEEGWFVAPVKNDGTALDVDEAFDITVYAICITAD